MDTGSKKLKPGKLDHQLLNRLVTKFTDKDERVVVGSKIGEDAAVIDMGSHYLLAKTDPITFVTDYIGYYAVNVNMNDIVCMGGTPKWFLATILLPQDCEQGLVENIFEQISGACRKENIILCGGHTEVTLGLDRPIVVGQMLGEAAKDHFLPKSEIQVNDRVILVNGVPIEGTAIIAMEKSRELCEKFSSEFVDKCRNYLFDPGIGVRREAQIALQTGAVRAMHDPTEGGIATALYELAVASGHGIKVQSEKILLLPEAKILCELYGINPFGCISSGSLLVVMPEQHVNIVLKAYHNAGIPADEIGKIVPQEQGYQIYKNGKREELPTFAQDEIVRIFS